MSAFPSYVFTRAHYGTALPAEVRQEFAPFRSKLTSASGRVPSAEHLDTIELEAGRGGYWLCAQSRGAVAEGHFTAEEVSQLLRAIRWTEFADLHAMEWEG